ncbi:MAG: elongation factor G-like protein EF-G2 [Nocardioidaceae bacterium]|nr:elongation factor G-like protein EF-G2 [Nocardioidaceae bacterium]
MADRSGGPATTGGSAPVADRPEGVRNVVLVGPLGSGKTTLIEHLLLVTGALSRAGTIEAGTTVSDHDEAEVRQQRSVGVALAPLVVDGIKVNLLDTPGYADYVGEVRAGLRAADCALFVLSAAEPVDGAARAAWQECEAVGMPRAIVITKLDHPRADYAGTLAALRDAFGETVVSLYLPLGAVGGATGAPGLGGLLSQQVLDYADWPETHTRTERSARSDEADAIATARGELIEAVIEGSEDESLMDRYLEGEEIDVKVLIADLETAVASARLFPVIPACTHSGVGVEELIEILTQAFPAPVEHPMPSVFTTAGARIDGLTCDPDGPLLAEVVKTTSDPYVGRVSLVRVFSGTLRADSVVHVSGHSSQFRGRAGTDTAPDTASDRGQDMGHADHDEDEKVGALASPLGKALRPVAYCVAGDLCSVAKLTRAETGDSISDKDRPLLMEPWSMPEPLFPVAVEAHAKADEDKLSLGLTRLAAEDPTLRIEHNPDTRQLVLWTMGEAHADVLVERLRLRYGVTVDRVDVRVALRETFGRPSAGRGRHVKQSGGHGQFAVCEIEVEPLPTGGGFEFVDKVVGGSVPRQFIPSVEKGVIAQMEHGVVTGNQVVDIKVTLVDGKAHSVDSSDMAFQTAGGLALREAAAGGDVVVLEPVDTVAVLIDDDFVGAVMGDLSSRRARVLGTEAAVGGRTVVRAEVPDLELLRYAVDLRSLSHGTGSFSRQYARFEPLPGHLVAKLTPV